MYLIDMIKALHYCHRVIKVIHRDIKPDNIMINHNQEAVLIDFGVSALVDKENDDSLKSAMGTFIYFAPEMLKFSKDGSRTIRGEQTDLWALGITFFQLLTGRTPYEHCTNLVALKEAIVNEPIDFSLIQTAGAREVIAGLLNKDPLKRHTLDMLLDSTWVTRNGSQVIKVD